MDINLSEVLPDVVATLSHFDDLREQLISETRILNRLSGKGISYLVKEEPVEEILHLAGISFKKIDHLMETLAPLTSWRTSISGVEEYSELLILYNIIVNKKLVDPKTTGIPVWIWLTSMGDVVGELRRIILNKLLNDRYEKAFELLGVMQSLYHEMSGLSFSKAIIPNLRKKIDASRLTVERTESDVLSYKISVKRGE